MVGTKHGESVREHEDATSLECHDRYHARVRTEQSHSHKVKRQLLLLPLRRLVGGCLTSSALDALQRASPSTNNRSLSVPLGSVQRNQSENIQEVAEFRNSKACKTFVSKLRR